MDMQSSTRPTPLKQLPRIQRRASAPAVLKAFLTPQFAECITKGDHVVNHKGMDIFVPDAIAYKQHTYRLIEEQNIRFKLTGLICKYIDPKTNAVVDIKIVPKSSIYKNLKKLSFQREAFVLNILKEKNMKKEGMHDLFIPSKANLKDMFNYYLVMESPRGMSLTEKINQVLYRPKPEQEQLYRIILSKCIPALEYLHSLGIIHCNIKPDNIYFDGKQIKISDFEFAYKEGYGQKIAGGSPDFTSPQVLKGMDFDSTIDAFSLGMSLLHACAFSNNMSVFSEDDPNYIQHRKGLTQDQIRKFLAGYSDVLVDLLSHVLTPAQDPSKRFSLAQMKAHSWFTEDSVTPLKAPTPHHLPLKIEESKTERVSSPILQNTENLTISTKKRPLPKTFSKNVSPAEWVLV